jgi:polyisoprenoid-binding protein YceI
MPSRLSIRTILLLAACAVGIAAALADTRAAQAQELTRDLKQIPGGEYTLDANHATVVFMVSHFGYASYIGRFNSPSGSLKLNVKNPVKSKLSVTIDVNSVDTPSEALDNHLRTPDFFNVEKYPEAKFKSTKIEKLDDRTGKVTGDLTLMGVTKPVTFDVTFNGGSYFEMAKAYKVGFSARGTIKRSDFGMSGFLPFIGDEVSLIIEAEFMQPSKASS